MGQLLKFDAEDDSGNKAEQVVIGYNIIDNVSPEITPCTPKNKNAINSAQYKHDNPSAAPYVGCDDGTTTAVTDEVDGGPAKRSDACEQITDLSQTLHSYMTVGNGKNDGPGRCYWKTTIRSPTQCTDKWSIGSGSDS